MNKILVLLSFICVVLFADNPQVIKQNKDNTQNTRMAADETLYREIEGILSKFDTNANIMQKNIEEMKRLKKLNNEINKDNENLMTEIDTKCKALKILNGQIANDICKKMEEQIEKAEEDKRVYIKLNDEEIFKKYPKIEEDLFSQAKHIEFQIKEEEGRMYAKRKTYSIPLEEYNKLEDSMFVMIRLHKNKFTVTAYKPTLEDKWKAMK